MSNFSENLSDGVNYSPLLIRCSFVSVSLLFAREIQKRQSGTDASSDDDEPALRENKGHEKVNFALGHRSFSRVPLLSQGIIHLDEIPGDSVR